MQELLCNQYFVWGTMAVIIFLLTQLVKLPIKLGTSRIKDEAVRKRINVIILLIPFALGIIADFLYSTYIIHTSVSILTGIGYGTAGISIYNAFEALFKAKNPYKTKEGEIALDLVSGVKKGDKNAVSEFWDKMKE